MAETSEKTTKVTEKQADNNYIRIPLPSKNTATPILAILLAIAAFYSGYATSEIKNLKAGATTTPTTAVNNAAAPAAAPAEDTTPRKVSMDDDAVLGDKNAPVTIIEFSDYECPFCKQYFDQTYPQLKKEYIDTGKVKLVFRDLPLSFHANAQKQAEAAECAREQGGDEVYYQYHDEIFTRTTSGGTGLALTELSPLATELGLDGAALQKCLDDGTFAKEVTDDLAYSSTVGASATPSFFIGKSDSSGTITAAPLVGAQPYTTFKAEIDKLL